MRALLVVVAALAACNDPPGLTLEVVKQDPAITSVELFVGERCDSCPPSMAPPGLRARRTDINIVNDSAVFLGEMHGNSALFRLTSNNDQDLYVPVLIAVGFNASDEAIAVSTLHDVTVPFGNGEYWKTFLEPTTPIADPDPDADGERIAIWPAKRIGPRCIMVEHGRYSADTVVPQDDTDCDGVMASLECAPFAPSATKLPPTIERASCVKTALSAGGTTLAGLCLLGGPPCTETNPSTTGCEPLIADYCITTAACNACTGLGGNWACVAEYFSGLDLPTSAPSHAKCVVPMTPTGDECPADVPGAQDDADLDLSPFLQGSNGAKCRDVLIDDLPLPMHFTDTVKLGSGTLTVKNVQDNCLVTVDWSGPLGTTPARQILVADVLLDNHKHLVFPFAFEIGDCTHAMACKGEPAANDALLLCNRPVTDSTTCPATTAACPNGLVACGGRCCGTGESCIDGFCTCGAGPHCIEGDACVASTEIPPPPGACGELCCGSFGCP